MIAILLALTSLSHADFNQSGRYQQQARVNLLKQVFGAFSESAPEIAQNTQRMLRSQSRYACGSDSPSLKIQCLMEAAKAACNEQKNSAANCLLISDVVISNIVEENSFITRRELQKILRRTRTAGDPALSALSGRYARLTADYMTVSGDACGGQEWGCLAEGIDKFCVQQSDDKKQSWQSCAGAIAWSIGSPSGRKMRKE